MGHVRKPKEYGRTIDRRTLELLDLLLYIGAKSRWHQINFKPDTKLKPKPKMVF